MKRTKRLLPLLMAIVMMAMSPQMMWAGGTKPTSGSGTIDAPYIITSEANLIWFRDAVNGVNTGTGTGTNICAKLTADITLTSAWTGIGTSTKKYNGTFYGNKKTIKGLSGSHGLFAYTTGTAKSGSTENIAIIKNLTLEGAISASTGDIGSFVEQADGSTRLYNVESKVNITISGAKTHIGGIMGGYTHTVGEELRLNGCTYSGAMNVGSSIDSNGGIIGYVGIDANVEINHCFFAGSITSSGSNPTIGGILGYARDDDGGTQNFSYLKNCFCSGSITGSGTSNMGIFVGYPNGSNVVKNIIDNTYVVNTNSSTGIKMLGHSKTAKESNKAITISVKANNDSYGKVTQTFVNPTSNDSTLLQVKATPNTGYHFASWSDSGKQTHTVGLTSDVSLTATFHQLTGHTAKEATCAETGISKDYWTCTTCNKHYSDNKGNTETTLADVTIAANANAHTWSDDTHTYCNNCEHSWIYYTATSRVNPFNTESLSGYADDNNTYDTTTKKGVIEFTSRLESIGDGAFSNCDNLQSITIPSRVTSIGYNAFYNCYNLQSIIIPSSVTSIGEEAFENCTGLRTVFIIGREVSIQGGVFDNCRNLSSIYVYRDRMNEYMNADYWSDYKDKIKPIPQTVITYTATEKLSETTDNAAFGLHTNAFGGLTIKKHDFDAETEIGTITIDGTLTSIEDKAFFGCAGLTAIYLGTSTIPSLGTNVFDGCTDLTAIYVPLDCVESYKGATNWSDYASMIKYDSRCVITYTATEKLVEVTDATTKGLFVYGFDTSDILTHTFADGKGTISFNCPLTSIGQSAFYGCSDLQSITIPSSVVAIDVSAFEGCTSLRSINIPSSIIVIDESAFEGCTSLQSITIPSSVIFIGESAFEGCTSLQSITIPSSVDDIGRNAFFGCYISSSNLKNDSTFKLENYGLTIFDTEQNDGLLIKDNTAVSCRKWAKEVTIPSSVTSIGSSAFKGCTKLQSIIIPSSVTSIGEYAFEECESLQSITIPSSLTSIGKQVFWYCTGLETITIPSSVTSIGNQAFWYCTKLETITIPSSVTSIGNQAFGYCTGLQSITIPSNVTSIGNQAFQGCSSLSEVYCDGETPASLGSNAFYNANKLSVIYVPTDSYNSSEGWKEYSNLISVIGTTIITYKALYRFDSIDDDASLFGTDLTITSHTFEVEEGVGKITFSGSVTKIGNGAFYNSSLQSISIPNTVTSIGNNAFYGCTGLKSITLPDGVTSIGDRAFYDCTDLQSFTIPSGVTSIGEAVFEHCIDLQSIVIPEGVTSIGNYAFMNCINLTSITIPSDVTNIGNLAFLECYNLQSISIPSSVTSIGIRAFEDCCVVKDKLYNESSIDLSSVGLIIADTEQEDGLLIKDNSAVYCRKWATNVTIPNSVTSIGNGAFRDCYNLQSITLPEGLTSIGDEAFQSCKGLQSITIPSRVKSIGDYAFRDCTKLSSVAFQSIPEKGESPFLNTNDCKFSLTLTDDSYIYYDYDYGWSRNYDSAPTYTREMNYEWGTVVVPFAITYDASNDKYKLYKYTATLSNALVFKEYADQEVIPAGTPMAIKAVGDKNSETGKYTVTLTAKDFNLKIATIYGIINVGGLGMHGTYYRKEDLRFGYFIARNMFWYAVKPVTIPPFHAWFTGSLPTSADGGEVKTLSIVVEGEDETTSIASINNEQLIMNHEDGVVYNLSGQRLAAPQKGINIINGKKVLVR